jgi:hypothetical protein
VAGPFPAFPRTVDMIAREITIFTLEFFIRSRVEYPALQGESSIL